MGSGGSYVGYLATKELGFKYVDWEILQRAAKHLGTSKDTLKDLDERSMGLVKSIIRGVLFRPTGRHLCTSDDMADL